MGAEVSRHDFYSHKGGLGLEFLEKLNLVSYILFLIPVLPLFMFGLCCVCCIKKAYDLDQQMDKEERARQQKVMEELKNDRLKYHKFKGEVFNRYHNRNVIRR